MQWYEAERWRSRLIVEQELMASRFPVMSLLVQPSGDLAWEGNLEPCLGKRFLVSLTYPANYPLAEPVARVIDPPLPPGTPYVYEGGGLCVYRKGVRWKPDVNTAASQVGLVTAWLVQYLTATEGRAGG